MSRILDEPLILVDEGNRSAGTAGKMAVHRAGLLHRAFSIFIVDERGRIVLQQRSAKKYHSAGLWANSCCGHPRPGERTLAAAHRRLNEELGIASPLSFGFYSRYRADLDHGMHENEFVYVYFGALTAQPCPDPARSPRSSSRAPSKSTGVSSNSRILSRIGSSITCKIIRLISRALRERRRVRPERAPLPSAPRTGTLASRFRGVEQ